MRAAPAVAILLALPIVSVSAPQAAAADPVFSFGAAGDFGYGASGQATIAAAGAAGLDFFLALGDTAYTDTNETNWCNGFKAQVPDLLVEAGNHDVGEDPGSNLNALLAACPYTLSETMTGTYGREWYFDYPAASPLARFILTACGVNFVVDGSGTWSCAQGDSHYNFVANAIDAARTASIPWVVVGMHKNCITAATKSCEIGSAFFSMLVTKRVDLILQGHDHVYHRSKQLTCATVSSYSPSCVADDGADGSYRKGQGAVLTIAGMGGRSHYAYNSEDTEAPYFAAVSDSAYGFLRVDVSEGALSARFVWSGGAAFTDAFTISAAPALAVSQPVEGASFTTGAVVVAGTSDPDATVSVNGARADVQLDGSFSVGVPLWPGSNVLNITARNAFGVAASSVVNVTYIDPTPALQAQLAGLEARAAAVDLNVTAIRSDLDAAAANLSVAQADLTAATAALSALSDELDATAAALGLANSNLSRAEADLSALEASGNATAADVQAARDNATAARDEVAALATSHSNTLQELQDASANASAAAAQVGVAAGQIAALQLELAALAARIATLEQQPGGNTTAPPADNNIAVIALVLGVMGSALATFAVVRASRRAR